MIPSSARARFAWALYDWANSPYTTLIVTFVFPAYFLQAVVGDAVAGQALWAAAMGASGLLVALAGPVLGARADATGRRKPWLGGFTVLCVFGSLALYFVAPAPVYMILALLLVVISNLGFEGACIFYNAMLVSVSGPERLGRLSGMAWGLGYAGGLAALLLVLWLLRLEPEAVRWVGPIAGVWLALFALPLFVWVPESGAVTRPVPLWQSLCDVAGRAPLWRFLLAHMLYADGLVTLFAMGGVYVAGEWGFALEQVLLFGILLNVTAGLGAVGFGWMDDRLGWKPTILVSLAGLSLAGAGLLLVQDVAWVWGLGALLGLFVGPAQAAGRSGLARLAPPERQAEMFGLYALVGKATAFLGPWLVGAVTLATSSQRLGMAVPVALFVLGALVLATVRARPADSSACPR